MQKSRTAMNYSKLFLPALVLSLASLQAVHAADLQAGKEKAQQLCASCHGPTGAAETPLYPIIAGQYADYLLHSLKAYKSGKRQNSIMAGIVSGLSEKEMRDLSAYFASQQGLTDLSID